jgi:hypothetical protein
LHVLPKKGASIAISSGLWVSINLMVRSKMILVSDNGCHIWTIAIVELQNSIFLFTIFIKPNPIIVVPGSIPNMMRSFAKSFVFFITQRLHRGTQRLIRQSIKQNFVLFSNFESL